MIHLDYNATTPLDAAVGEAVAAAARDFPANPSSVHSAGRRARAALEEARRRVAVAFGAPAAEAVVFVSSGSEANNLAIKGLVHARLPRPAHLVVSAIEHDSVHNAVRALAAAHPAVSFTEVPPDRRGGVDPDRIEAALRPETVLVSLMLANHETGVVQPVAEVTRRLVTRGVALHCDAVQAPGRWPVDMVALGCDLLTVAAHKFNGPRGVGALLVRPGLSLEPQIHGGLQEAGRRAGTENLPGAIGMALAAELAVARRAANVNALRELERAFLDRLLQAKLPLERHGEGDDKLSGVLNLAIRGLSHDDLVVGMDVAGVAISAGSACASGVIEHSRVLRAMALPEWQVAGGIRISFGPENTRDEALAAADRLIELSRRLLAEGVSNEAQSA